MILMELLEAAAEAGAGTEAGTEATEEALAVAADVQGAHPLRDATHSANAADAAHRAAHRPEMALARGGDLSELRGHVRLHARHLHRQNGRLMLQLQNIVAKRYAAMQLDRRC